MFKGTRCAKNIMYIIFTQCCQFGVIFKWYKLFWVIEGARGAKNSIYIIYSDCIVDLVWFGVIKIFTLVAYFFLFCIFRANEAPLNFLTIFMIFFRFFATRWHQVLFLAKFPFQVILMSLGYPVPHNNLFSIIYNIYLFLDTHMYSEPICSINRIFNIFDLLPHYYLSGYF